MSTVRKELGNKGELLVANYLQKQGYTIRQTNYAARTGEIDIIAEYKEVRIFVEVKLRTTYYFATSQVVTPAKQSKIIKTARYYNALQHENQDWIYRFDVALVDRSPGSNDYEITYITNAFTSEVDYKT